jgi:hypothetical protein
VSSCLCPRGRAGARCGLPDKEPMSGQHPRDGAQAVVVMTSGGYNLALPGSRRSDPLLTLSGVQALNFCDEEISGGTTATVDRPATMKPGAVRCVQETAFAATWHAAPNFQNKASAACGNALAPNVPQSGKTEDGDG